MADKCPKCGADCTHNYAKWKGYACGLREVLTTGFLESKRCLHRQLAQKETENKRLREANEQLACAVLAYFEEPTPALHAMISIALTRILPDTPISSIPDPCAARAALEQDK